MLLRLDPDRNAIALMSIPRDLKVEIPGYGTEKFNAAYTYGGAETDPAGGQGTDRAADQPRRQRRLPRLRPRRRRDRLRLRRRRPPLLPLQRRPAASEQYAEINVQPGYQLLCGKKALQYVRYRHTDTDLVRSARQQDFLSAARQRVPVAGPASSTATQPDRHLHRIHDLRHQRRRDDAGGAETVHRLAQRGDQRGPLPGRTRAELRLRHAGSDRRRGRRSSSASKRASGPRGTLEEEPEDQQERQGEEEGEEEEEARRSRRSATPKPPGSDGLVPAREAGEPEAKIVARKVSGGFPVFYPTRLPSGAGYVETNPYEHVQDPRVYHLKDTDGKRHAAYRMVVERRTLRRHPLLRRPGHPRLVGPADPQQPERNARRSTAANTRSTSTAIAST